MLKIDYLVDLRMLKTEPARLVLKDVTYYGRAPQARIANQVLAKLDAAPALPLDRLLLELILLIVKDQPSKELISDGEWQRNKEVAVDPLIKVTMLRAVLDQAVEYNLLFRQALGPLKTKVHDTYAWRADWIKHDDRDAKVRREDAKLLLEELTAKIQRSPALIEDGRNKVRSLAQWRQETLYRTFGWLDRDDQGLWIVRTMEPQDRDGKLYCLVPDIGVNPIWRMQRIGHVQGKRVELTDSTWFQAGRLVYLSRDAKSD